MLQSLKRGAWRMLALFSMGVVDLLLSDAWPQVLGPIGTPMAFGLGLTFLGLAFGDLALRIYQPHIDSQLVAEEAIKDHNTAAGLIYLGRSLLACAILLLMVSSSRAQEPPEAAKPLLPLLKQAQTAYWPDMALPSTLGAQVEQETCITLKHRSCWNPRAELKTSREQGVGLGQLTRAFNPNGSTRFDAMTDLTKVYSKELAGLDWKNPYDPALQLRALVLKDKQSCGLIKGAKTPRDQLAMCFAAYNGGSGGLNSDRKVCAGTKGCDPGQWFGHVENTSLKAKAALPGYGKSFFAVNREYVTNIMVVREPRYRSLNA